jgi:dipeptidyl aminopeptidase/acylaminoacyl peptidase
MKKISIILKFMILLIVLTSCLSINNSPRKRYSEDDININNGSYDIPATLVMPISNADVPVVILLHGTGSQKDEAGDGFKMLAIELANNGIASIRFDFPGSGSSKVSYELYSNSTAIADTLSVANYAKNIEGIDPNRIGILGWSQGGSDALLAAGSSDMFKSVATWAGSLSLSDMVTPQMREEATANGYAIMNFDWREPLHLSKKWIDEADSMNILNYVSKIKAPIASFHGDEDQDVPLEESIKVQTVAMNLESKLFIIQGTGHTYGIFSGDLTKFKELENKTVLWFKTTL